MILLIPSTGYSQLSLNSNRFLFFCIVQSSPHLRMGSLLMIMQNNYFHMRNLFRKFFILFQEPGVSPHNHKTFRLPLENLLVVGQNLYHSFNDQLAILMLFSLLHIVIFQTFCYLPSIRHNYMINPILNHWVVHFGIIRMLLGKPDDWVGSQRKGKDKSVLELWVKTSRDWIVEKNHFWSAVYQCLHPLLNFLCDIELSIRVACRLFLFKTIGKN